MKIWEAIIYGIIGGLPGAILLKLQKPALCLLQSLIGLLF